MSENIAGVFTREKLFIIPLLLGFMALPFFMKAMWPKKTKKSLVLKMTCSTFFLLTGILSAWGSQNKSAYAKLMLAGLFLGWLGDFLMHVKQADIFFIFGLVSFLLGHILYIAAFTFAATRLGLGSRGTLLMQIIVFALLLVAMIVFLKVEKFDMGANGVAVFAYSAVIIAMVVKALNLSITLLKSGMSFVVPTMIIVGAISFLISDTLLALFNFGGRHKNYPLKIVNILTYFIAQNLLACSLLLIK